MDTERIAMSVVVGEDSWVKEDLRIHDKATVSDIAQVILALEKARAKLVAIACAAQERELKK